MMVADGILDGVMLWGALGAAVALAFLTVGIDRIDEDARDAYVFRLLLVPGVMLLWPMVLWRWRVLETGRDAWRLRHAPPRRAHRQAAALLAVAVPLILVTALMLRQDRATRIAPERISPPSEATR